MDNYTERKISFIANEKPFKMIASDGFTKFKCKFSLI